MRQKEKPLVDRTALITGSSKRLGAAIARDLAEAGACVVIHFREDRQSADVLTAQLRGEGYEAFAFGGNLSIEQDCRDLVKATVAHAGSIDVLINNVGPYSAIALKQLPSETWDYILDTNVKSSFLLSQLAFQQMNDRGWGRIVNISAGSAFFRDHSVYGLAKNALLVLTEALAVEFSPKVLVNAIAPGMIDDPSVSESLRERFRRDTPLQRLVTFEEVAQLVALVCGSAFDMVTGQVITLDGGQSIPRMRPQNGSRDL